MAAAVAREVRHMRKTIPNATIGVLFDRRLGAARLDRLRARLTVALAGDHVDVHVVPWNDGETGVQRTNCVLLISVEQTKGLEFDAVVLFGDGRAWTQAVLAGDEIAKNRIYVAASRAKQGLALVSVGDPEFLRPLLDCNACVRVRSR
jgi:hypothetical protein